MARSKGDARGTQLSDEQNLERVVGQSSFEDESSGDEEDEGQD